MSLPLKSPAMLSLIRHSLDGKELTDVLDASALALESMRQLVSDLFDAYPAERDFIDSSVKPIIRELLKRSVELHQLPIHRGNA